jgi:hypothetical protein
MSVDILGLDKDIRPCTSLRIIGSDEQRFTKESGYERQHVYDLQRSA